MTDLKKTSSLEGKNASKEKNSCAKAPLFTKNRPLTIVISALGGQGGGVLTNWIVSLAKQKQYFAQATSVPGVAQRTGATIYYLEIFPKAEGANYDNPPIMALMPTLGDVDLVVASELMEAGRAVQREYVTPGKTTLITSNHRVYSISEKMHMGDGRGDSDTVLKAALEASKTLISFDMEKLSNKTGCMISSVLFGSIAGANILPFSREDFENAIRVEGKMVDINLKGFGAGFNAAQKNIITDIFKPVKTAASIAGNANHPQSKKIIEEINQLPLSARELAYAGCKSLLDFQDISYAEEYISILKEYSKIRNSSEHIIKELSRSLALWMAFDDVIKVSDLKIRAKRTADYRNEVKAQEGQIVQMIEFMHPRLEEIIGIMPVKMARFAQKSKLFSKFLGLFTGAKKYDSSKLFPFLMLYFIASLKGMRRKTLRYYEEKQLIDSWLIHVKTACEKDHDLALEIIKCQRIIKGYGETHQRGQDNFKKIMSALGAENITAKNITAKKISALHKAALSDEDSHEFNRLFAAL